MKISVAKSAGFCFGVKRALQIVSDTTSNNKNIYMLGDIVHNEDVVRQIKKLGIKKIKKLTFGKQKTLLIRAHGASLKTLQRAKKLGYHIVDATCPMVKGIHKIAVEMEKKGYTIIVIGDKLHNEVQGIIGQLKNKALVIDTLSHIPVSKIKTIKQAAVVVQSTQNIENVLRIIPVLRRYIKKLDFFNTICRPTRIKQEEIKKLPQTNDCMIIIGSKTSANTKRLFEIARNINKKTYWVQSKKDLRKEWFKAAKSVGVTSGSSTPDSTTKKIVDYIKRLN